MNRHTVCLPIERDPIFPPECALCAQSDPETNISATDTAMMLGLPVRIAPAKKTLSVPACVACRRAFQRRKWWRRLLGLGLFIAVLGIGGVLVEDWLSGNGLLFLLAQLLLLSVAILPFLALRHLLPQRFSFGLESGVVCFKFAQREVAAEFARINDAMNPPS